MLLEVSRFRLGTRMGGSEVYSPLTDGVVNFFPRKKYLGF